MVKSTLKKTPTHGFVKKYYKYQKRLSETVNRKTHNTNAKETNCG